MGKPGKRIRNLRDLAQAMHSHRSVCVPSLKTYGPWRAPRPAAFVMQQSAEMVLEMISMGLFVYEKGKPISRFGKLMAAKGAPHD